MRSAACLVGLLLAAPAGAESPYGIANARLERRAGGASGLASLVGDSASRPGPLWIGWSVPANRRSSSCCWSSRTEGAAACRGCRLEAGDGFVGGGDEPVALEGGGGLRVLLRAEGARVGRIRAFSEDCPLDAAGLPLVWIEDVRPAESVSLLAGFVAEPRDEGSRRLVDGATAAIAFHADPSADQALERFLSGGQPLELRKQAAFWMGEARGARGYQVLSRLLREDADPKLREHAIFALTQSQEPKAVDTIIEVAHHDPDAHVRGQALFWLAETASRRAPDAIRSAVDDDPEIGVKKKAVFALSQLPKDEGLPLLIGLARTHQSYEVRKQAMFWLGQSGDPRALAFFEDVLGR